LAYTGIFARISQLSSGHIPSLTPKPVVGISQTGLGQISSSGHTNELDYLKEIHGLVAMISLTIWASLSMKE